jgi:ankyrin repeat protein
MPSAAPALYQARLLRRIHRLLTAGALVLSAGLSATSAQAPAPVSPQASAVAPLLEAAAAGDTATVKSLVAAGISVNATDALGRTALMLAVKNRQMETVKALAGAGADLNRESRIEGSALNIAENDSNIELAAWLLAAGAHSTGKSVGDTVCVRPWNGQGFCGKVKAFTVKSVQIAVTRLEGCAGGCAARQECSASNPVGGVNGLQAGEDIAVPSWCLTQTGVKQ